MHGRDRWVAAGPRRSGKSTLLIKEWLKDPENSFIICTNTTQVQHLQALLWSVIIEAWMDENKGMNKEAIPAEARLISRWDQYDPLAKLAKERFMSIDSWQGRNKGTLSLNPPPNVLVDDAEELMRHVLGASQFKMTMTARRWPGWD